MDGLRNVTGPSCDFEAGGKTYKLACTAMEVLAEFESAVLARRPNPLSKLAEVIDEFPPAMHRELIDSAMAEVRAMGMGVSMSESMAFLSTTDGRSLFFWRAAQKDSPELDSLAKAREIVVTLSPAKTAELMDKLAEVSGLKALADFAKN